MGLKTFSKPPTRIDMALENSVMKHIERLYNLIDKTISVDTNQTIDTTK
jgi:hypothetical protein